MSSNPFFSIVIPTFNSALYLYECLESLARQTCKDYEVIVVDKQSSDCTLDMICSVDMPRLQVKQQTTNSLPEALDEGFSVAKGILFTWLNSDDAYARPDALSIIKSKYIQHPAGYRFIYANHLCIDANSCISSLSASHWPSSRYERALGGFNLCTGSLFFSRDLFISFGGFGDRYRLSFEYLLIDYLFLHGRPLYVPVYVYAYRLHASQLSDRLRDQMASECRDISISLPRRSAAGFFLWLCKRLFSRILFSNYFQRRLWIGSPLEVYWHAHSI
jgi:glycosyltransferase involved in cell wall biosynthesis